MTCFVDDEITDGDEETVAAAVTRLREIDFVRRSPRLSGLDAGHKEWLHFCVHGRDVDLVVNLSLVDEQIRGDWTEVGRTTLMCRTDRGWSGGVTRHVGADLRAVGGTMHLDLGTSRLRLEPSGVFIRVDQPEHGLRLEGMVTPQSWPMHAPDLRVAAGTAMHWVVTPRIAFSGLLTVRGTRTRLHRASGYHDHNWGSFTWGADFGWVWGYVVPDDPTCPWTAAFVQMTDRARTRTTAQALFLWRDGVQHRTFRDDEVTTRRTGVFEQERWPRFPTAMRLTSPEMRFDVPQVHQALGKWAADSVDIRFQTTASAQMMVPNETDLGVTRINETVGHAVVTGQVMGERIAFAGRGFYEFLGQ